VKVEAVK
jgi:hypothetical protein